MAKGAWALLDQAVFALSNFGINIVLARRLPPHDYGAFTLAYSVFLLLGTIHSALLIEPMLVFGSGKYRETLSGYFAVLLQGHWVLTAGTSLTLAAGGIGLNFIGQQSVGVVLIALAIANPFILLLWLIRRSCCIRSDLRLAASGGIFYSVVLVAGCYALIRVGWFSSFSVFVLMGAASLIGALWIKSGLPSGSSRAASGLRRDIAAHHWAFGRWAVGTGVLGALMLNLYYIVIPARHGLESTATLKALMNLNLPVLHSTVALSVTAIPLLVKLRGTSRFGGAVRTLLALFSAGGLLYWLALGISHQHVVRWLYGQRYAGESHLLWLVGAVSVACALLSVLEAALRSLERSDEVFRAYLLGCLSTGGLGIPLTLAWGPAGAIAGLLGSYGIAVGAMASNLLSHARRG